MIITGWVLLNGEMLLEAVLRLNTAMIVILAIVGFLAGLLGGLVQVVAVLCCLFFISGWDFLLL